MTATVALSFWKDDAITKGVEERSKIVRSRLQKIAEGHPKMEGDGVAAGQDTPPATAPPRWADCPPGLFTVAPSLFTLTYCLLSLHVALWPGSLPANKRHHALKT